MPEKNKCDTEKEENTKEELDENKDVWSEDQKNRRYYYDDAHGYETYKPDEEEDED